MLGINSAFGTSVSSRKG